jgi:hypothetical protein
MKRSFLLGGVHPLPWTVDDMGGHAAARVIRANLCS